MIETLAQRITEAGTIVTSNGTAVTLTVTEVRATALYLAGVVNGHTYLVLAHRPAATLAPVAIFASGSTPLDAPVSYWPTPWTIAEMIAEVAS